MSRLKVLYGFHAVTARVRADASTIEEILYDPTRKDRRMTDFLRTAKEAGIPVYTVGIGNPTEGGKIPTRDGHSLMHGDREVVTRLQPRLLQEIAKRTKGTYTEAGVNPPRLGELFQATIERGPKRAVLDDALPSYQQRYPWFFAAALFFLSAEMMLGRDSKKKGPGTSNGQESAVSNRPSATPLAV